MIFLENKEATIINKKNKEIKEGLIILEDENFIFLLPKENKKSLNKQNKIKIIKIPKNEIIIKINLNKKVVFLDGSKLNTIKQRIKKLKKL